jgi:hypothetical protein
MTQTVIGVFDSYQQATLAQGDLVARDFPSDMMHLKSADSGKEPADWRTEGSHESIADEIRDFFANLFGSAPPAESTHYSEAVRRGGTLLVVDGVSDARIDLAKQILVAAGAVDINERLPLWHADGYPTQSGMDTGAAFPASPLDSVRAYPRVIDDASPETTDGGPLGSNAALSAQFAGTVVSDGGSVEGIDAPNRAASHGSAGSLDNRPGVGTASAEPLVPRDEALEYGALDQEFQEDYRSRYAALDGPYEDYAPAYRHGYDAASATTVTERGDASWESIEPGVREDWERSHPESNWERFKQAVRHGWERVTH